MNTRENTACFDELETERPQDIRFEQFTKRTNDPKLTHIEGLLDAAGIIHRRNGNSWHAPILDVDTDRLDDAWAILAPIDDIPDDDPQFTED